MTTPAKVAFAILIFGYAAAHAADVRRIKKVKYKSHTEIDFTGSSVEGKVHSPEVFYIFQSRWSKGPDIIRAPASMNYNRPITRQTLEGQL